MNVNINQKISISTGMESHYLPVKHWHRFFIALVELSGGFGRKIL